MLMYSKDFKIDKSYTVKNPQVNLSQSTEQLDSMTFNQNLMRNLTGSDDQSTLKFLVYAINKSQILVRLTNMEDKFDQVDSKKQLSKEYTVDLRMLAETLYD